MSTPREHLAWLIWCYAQGYRTPEDREFLKPIFEEPLSTYPRDVKYRESLLQMADETLALVKNEFEPTIWFRVIRGEDELYLETSDEKEAREAVEDGCRLQRMYLLTETEWRDVPPSIPSDVYRAEGKTCSSD